MAGQTQIRAGQAYVGLGMRDNKLSAGLREASSKLKAWGSAIQGVGEKLMVAGGLATAMGGLSFSFAEGAVNAGDLAAETGVALENIQTLGGALGGTEGLARSFEHMSSKITEAAQGSAEANDEFARLGLSAQQLATMPLDDAFKKIATAISDTKNSAQQLHSTQELLGRGMMANMRIIKQGGPAIEKLQEAYAQHHQVFTEDDVAAAVKFKLAVGNLTGSFEKILMVIGKALLPVIEKWANEIVPIVDGIVTWVSNNQELIQTIFEIGAGVLAAGIAIYALGTAFSVLGSIISVVSAIAAAAMSPWIAIPAILVGVVAYLAWTGGAFNDFADTCTEAWGGIVDAIKAGDLGLAFKIAVQGLYIIWLTFRNWIMLQWDSFLIGWKRIQNMVLGVWDWLITQLRIGWIRFKEFFSLENEKDADAEIDGLHAQEAAHQIERDKDERATVEEMGKHEDARVQELTDAKAKLHELTQQAHKEAVAARAPKPMKEPPPPDKKDAPWRKSESVGTFSAAAAGGLGLGLESNMAAVAANTASIAASNQVIANNLVNIHKVS